VGSERQGQPTIYRIVVKVSDIFVPPNLYSFENKQFNDLQGVYV
jgi:hypothetical protein